MASADNNSYPNPDSYPVSSFRRPVPPPLVDPDEGDLLLVAYNPAWTPVLVAAVEQLLLPSTWQGDHDQIIDALNGASLLQWLLTEPAGTQGVPTPFWDDSSDLDDQETPEEQEWYGIFDGTFQETVENFVIAGFIAYSGQIGAAITFLTLAPRFRLAWKTGDLGGIIRVIIDGTDAGTVDTFAAVEGVIEQDFVGDPDLDEHEILMVLEEVP